MNPALPPVPDLDSLVDLFYDDPRRLGQFVEVAAEEMPANARRLLDHHQHMTVTVEAFHRCLVDVEVLAVQRSGHSYSRKILLRRQSDGQVVQFGIVRLDLSVLSPQVRQEIESRGRPLGRILIEHNVLRKVELASLWRIEPGEDLQRLFGLSSRLSQPPIVCYGRTALIYCDDEPAIELLEVVTPT